MNQNSFPSISVIIPVYNAQDYLTCCLDALVPYKDDFIEIILVNDGSTDSSLKICEDYVRDYSNIVLIDKENGGVSESRNVGVTNAKGRYICFIDSDDWITSKALYDLYCYAEKYGCDIVQMGYYYAYEDHLLLDNKLRKKYPDPVVFSKEQAMAHLVKDGIISNFVWGKLYKLELVRKTPFRSDISMGEDFYWMHRVIHKASKVGLIPIAGYFYRQIPGTLSSSFSEHHVSLLRAYEDRLLFIENHYPELYKDMLYAFWHQSYSYLNISKCCGTEHCYLFYLDYWNNICARYQKAFDTLLKWKFEYFLYRRSTVLLYCYSFIRRVYTHFFNNYQRVEVK